MTFLHKLKRYHASMTYGAVKLAMSTRLEPTRRSIIVFAPHPDDETFGCGGLIALKRKLGAAVTIVILTDGAKSHDTLSTVKPKALVELRKKEAISAARNLGVDFDDVIFLGLPDQGLKSLSGAAREQTVHRIKGLLEDVGAQEVYVTHRKDRHPDHAAAYELVCAAIQQSGGTFQVFQYPIWLVWGSNLGLRLSISDVSGAMVLNIGDVYGEKYQAILAYGSQLPVLPPEFVKQALKRYEIFFG